MSIIMPLECKQLVSLLSFFLFILTLLNNKSAVKCQIKIDVLVNFQILKYHSRKTAGGASFFNCDKDI